MRKKIIKLIKHKLFKPVFVLGVVLLLGSGISSVADDDIKSATNNFSAIGLVSEISEDSLKINEAKGSDKSGKVVYDLNIENLIKLETNKNIPINFSDIKIGDKVIVQGLTNGSTFFVKRIVSFTSIPTEVATSTEEIATSTATTTDDIVGTSTATTTLEQGENISTTTSTTTTEQVDGEINSTSTTQETPTIIETVIEKIKDVIENILDGEAGDTSATTTPVVLENASSTVTEIVKDVIENIVDVKTDDISSTDIKDNITENQIQDIPLQQLIENTENIDTAVVE